MDEGLAACLSTLHAAPAALPQCFGEQMQALLPGNRAVQGKNRKEHSSAVCS